MFTFKIERNQKTKPLARLIWLHGWGLDHQSLFPLAKYFSEYENIMVDFKGFGRSDAPSSAYGVPEYMEEIHELIKSHDDNLDIFVIGHSFGGRVGIELASRYPHLLKGLILIASAGLRRKRSIFFKIKAKIIKNLAKAFPKMKLGSRDYQNAKGVMRQVFVKTVNHDQESIAKNIKSKTLLIYGDKDTETPKEFGERFNKLIPLSKLYILKNLGHNTILTDGKFQVQNIMETFLSNFY